MQLPRPPSSQRAGSPTPSESNSLGALDLTPKQQPQISSPGPPTSAPSLFQSFGLLPGQAPSSLLSTSALSSLTSSVLTSTAFSPLRLAVGPGGKGGYQKIFLICVRNFFSQHHKRQNFITLETTCEMLAWFLIYFASTFILHHYAVEY